MTCDQIMALTLPKDLWSYILDNVESAQDLVHLTSCCSSLHVLFGVTRLLMTTLHFAISCGTPSALSLFEHTRGMLLCDSSKNTLLRVLLSRNDACSLEFGVTLAANGDAKVLELVLQEYSHAQLREEAVVLAAEAGHHECLDVLQPFPKGQASFEALCRASFHGHLACVQRLRHFTSRTSSSPLILAAAAGHDDCVEYLLSCGAILDAVDESGRSALGHACSGGHTTTVQLLLQHNAPTNTIDQDGESPLSLACERGRVVTVRELLLHGARATSRCLRHAVRGGFCRCVKLVAAFYDDHGGECLLYACYRGQLECARTLLSFEHFRKERSATGITPLMMACKCKELACVYAILEYGDVDVNAVDCNGRTALMFALQSQSPLCVRALMNDARVDVHVRDALGESALVQAIKRDLPFAMEAMMEKSCVPNGMATSMLSLACALGRDRCVDVLLKLHYEDRSIDFEETSESCLTPLASAAKIGHVGILNKLILVGCRVNHVLSSGDNALTIASFYGHSECVRILLANGSLQRPSCMRPSAIVQACVGDHVEVVQQLLSFATFVEPDGTTPLSCACKCNAVRCATLLLEHEASCTTLHGNDKSTPLFLAARYGHYRCVDALVRHMSALSISPTTDARGRTASQVAQLHGATACASLIDFFFPSVNVFEAGQHQDVGEQDAAEQSLGG